MGFLENRRKRRYIKSRQTIMTRGGRHTRKWFGGY